MAVKNEPTAKNGIKSKERVQKHGEVFTPDSIVNDMLDMVDNAAYEDMKDCTEEEKTRKYINFTVLEPACGDGQFLIRIIYRKLEAVKKLPVEERENAIVRAFCSVYGVDIQEDNVLEARGRMLDILKGNDVETFDNKEPKIFSIRLTDLGIDISDRLLKAVEFILKANIVVGNTLITEGSCCSDDLPPERKPVYFNEWKFNGDKVSSRLDFLYGGVPTFLTGSDKSEEVYFLDIDTIWGGYINPLERYNKASSEENDSSDESDEDWEF